MHTCIQELKFLFLPSLHYHLALPQSACGSSKDFGRLVDVRTSGLFSFFPEGRGHSETRLGFCSTESEKLSVCGFHRHRLSLSPSTLAHSQKSDRLFGSGKKGKRKGEADARETGQIQIKIRILDGLFQGCRGVSEVVRSWIFGGSLDGSMGLINRESGHARVNADDLPDGVQTEGRYSVHEFLDEFSFRSFDLLCIHSSSPPFDFISDFISCRNFVYGFFMPPNDAGRLIYRIRRT